MTTNLTSRIFLQKREMHAGNCAVFPSEMLLSVFDDQQVIMHPQVRVSIVLTHHWRQAGAK